MSVIGLMFPDWYQTPLDARVEILNQNWSTGDLGMQFFICCHWRQMCSSRLRQNWACVSSFGQQITLQILIAQ